MRKPEAHYVKPEQVRLGDTVRVVFAENDEGISVTRVGTIAKREYRGQERVMLTAQGGEVFSWVPGVKGPTVILLARNEAAEPETLFDNQEVWTFA